MLVVLLGVLFVLAGAFALYQGRATPGWLVLGVVLVVVGVILILVGLFDKDSEVLDEGMKYALSRN